MKLSSILSMFMLLTICSTSILGNNNENDEFEAFLKKQEGARGSKADLTRLWNTGTCDNCNLAGFDLREVAKKYRKINLSYSNCRSTNLSGANLYKANLFQVNFQWANLEEANLENAFATDADFSYANMKKAIMSKAQFYGAKFHQTNLEEANLENAVAEGAYMDRANMKLTNIKHAHFNRAYLRETNFKGAKVDEKTYFAGADCISTDFRKIPNLYKANFSGAVLYGCRVSHAPIPNRMRKQAKSIVGTLLKCCKTKDILGCKNPYVEIK